MNMKQVGSKIHQETGLGAEIWEWICLGFRVSNIAQEESGHWFPALSGVKIRDMQPLERGSSCNCAGTEKHQLKFQSGVSVGKERAIEASTT